MASQYLYCQQCGVSWVRFAQRGRPPLYCNTCKLYSQPPVRRKVTDPKKIILTDAGQKDSGIRETNDCTVRAIANACGVAYPEAHAFLEANGRKRGRGVVFETIVYRNPIIFGHTLIREHVVKSRGINMLLKRNPGLRRGTYVIKMHRHVATLKDGVLMDSFDSSRKDILWVYRVLKATDLI